MSELKLEVGKSYRTRSGKKVEDLKLNDSAVFPFRGLIKGIGWDIYQENGLYDVIEGAGDDIVAEWEDPTEIDMTVSREYLESKPESILQEADPVNYPSHYTSGKIECIDAIEAATAGLTGIEAVCTANAIKYLWRWKHKNGVEDLEKAQWFITHLIEKS